MQIAVESGRIVHSRGSISSSYPVLEAYEVGDTVLVIYDYMAFPQLGPCRNLFAYSAKTGLELWRAQDIGQGQVDAYTNFISEAPLVVGNFAGYSCELDIATGQVVNKVFTK